MSKRKYPEVKGYWVYSIKVPSINKYYIGVSKTQCNLRWRKSNYKNTVLKNYFNEWQSMEKTVLIDGLNREEALKYEDELIQSLSKDGLCINFKRSGMITNDKNAYMRELLKNNPRYSKQVKKYREDNREKYNKYHREYMRQNRLKKKQQQTVAH